MEQDEADFYGKKLAGAENVTQRKKSDRTFIDKLLKRTGRKKVAKIQFNNEGWMWRRVWESKSNSITFKTRGENSSHSVWFGLALVFRLTGSDRR